MNRSKALLGAAATAFSIAAFYGSSSKESGAPSSTTPSTSTESASKEMVAASATDSASLNINANNSVPSTLPAKSLLGLSQMMADKLPRSMPMPSTAWNPEWDAVKEVPKRGNEGGGGDEALAQRSGSDASPPSEVPTATRNLFLVRHGQYLVEKDDDCDRKLTPLGREQLDLTGSRLSELGFRFDRLVASTMTRARESANIVHGHLPQLTMELEPLLEEGAPVKPEPPTELWSPTEDQFREDGVRIEAAFKKYFHRASVETKNDTHEIVVCHGNVIRYCVCRALQIPPQAWLRMGLNHGSVTWISIRPSGRVVLRSLGVTGHMPPNKISSV